MTTRQEVEAFKQHRLWGSIDGISRVVEESAGRSQTDRETLARVLAVAKYVKSYRAVEAYLFPGSNRIGILDALAAMFDTIDSQLAGWDRDGAMLATTVGALDTYCDQILQQVAASAWPTARKGRSADAFAEAADAYRVQADASLEGIEAEVVSVNDRLTELLATADQIEVASRQREIEATAAVALISETQEAQTENAQESLQQELKRVTEAAQAQRDELGVEAQRFLAGLRDNYDTGNDLVKLIADQSVGGEYLRFAETEKRAYRLWNILGVIAGLVAFVYLAIVFWVDKPSLEGSILKLGISLSVLGLSAYAFREAGKRQRQSIEARYRALDVIAMPPFSKGLSKPQREQLTYLMGERLFGRSVESAASKRKSDDKVNAFNFSVDAATIKTVADTIQSLKNLG